MKTNKTTETRKTTPVETLEIRRVHAAGKIVFFDAVINGVTIYGLKVVEGKNGDFVSFPSTLGQDGKYYNTVFMALSYEDSKKILTAVQTKLDE